MKPCNLKLTGITCRGLLICALALMATIASHAQNAVADGNQDQAKKQHARYTVQSLGTLGGTFSIGNSINNSGLVTGQANLQGDQAGHAFLWTRKSGMTDLGTLGGPDSAVNWPVKNERGLIVGASDTSASDPFSEDFCFFGTGMICQGFTWEKGQMTPLGTLGGNNSQTQGANNRGQVVGFAENSLQDPSCAPPQVFDWEPVIWGLEKGQIQQLPLIPGDVTGAAAAINDEGQVAGGTGTCGPLVGRSFRHAVLWQNGTVTDLGNLGGAIRNFATAINDRGQVIGHSDLVGDVNHYGHGFLWTDDDGMQDLGTLPGDAGSYAWGMNNRGQVVGDSCDPNFANCRAFLWQNGVMTDLNTLTPSGSSLYLTHGSDINDQGEITGTATDLTTGETLAFLAVPTHDGDKGEDSVAQARDKVILPESLREQLRQGPGFGQFKAGLRNKLERQQR